MNALCPELWHVDKGRLTHKGKVAIIEDAFADPKSSKPGSVRNSAAPTPAASAGATPNVSGDERLKGGGSGLVSGTASPKPKGKKKLTRNQLKAREERRKARKLHWLTFGGEFLTFLLPIDGARARAQVAGVGSSVLAPLLSTYR